MLYYYHTAGIDAFQERFFLAAAVRMPNVWYLVYGISGGHSADVSGISHRTERAVTPAWNPDLVIVKFRHEGLKGCETNKGDRPQH